MKPNDCESKKSVENAASLAGDVIGDTAYSERFVLKIMLKFANLDSLNMELEEKSFEEDLCTLWDMTTERDVVDFLLKHKIFNLFNFALPNIESTRIIEILVGIIGNMCCCKEAIEELRRTEDLLTSVVQLIHSDDSSVLIQVLRLVSSCLFTAEESEVTGWLYLFKTIDFSSALAFILKNSTHKDLLVTALENLNSICSKCNIQRLETDFFCQFVTEEVIEGLLSTFTEVTDKQKDSCEPELLERVLLVSLQVMLSLVGFNKSPELYQNRKESVFTFIRFIFEYYKQKVVDQKEIDPEIMDIIDSLNTIVDVLKLNQSARIEECFSHSYDMWRAVKSINNSDVHPSFEDDCSNNAQMMGVVKSLKAPLCYFMSRCMEQCSEDQLHRILDKIGTDYEEVLLQANSQSTHAAVSRRAADYRTRLKESAAL